MGSISGVLGPFRGLYRAPKPTVLHWVYSASRILGHILTFSDPPSQPSQIILVQNYLKGVPHIVLHVLCSTCIPRGYLRPSEVRFRAILALSDNLFNVYNFFQNQVLRYGSWMVHGFFLHFFTVYI